MWPAGATFAIGRCQDGGGDVSKPRKGLDFHLVNADVLSCAHMMLGPFPRCFGLVWHGEIEKGKVWQTFQRLSELKKWAIFLLEVSTRPSQSPYFHSKIANPSCWLRHLRAFLVLISMVYRYSQPKACGSVWLTHPRKVAESPDWIRETTSSTLLHFAWKKANVIVLNQMNQQLQMVLKAWNIFKMIGGISRHKECTCLHVPACRKELVEDYSRGSRSAKIFCVKDSWLLLCRMFFFQKLLAKGWGTIETWNLTWVCTRSLQQDVAGCRCWDACLYLSRNDWDCGRAETVVSLDQERQSKLLLRFGLSLSNWNLWDICSSLLIYPDS